MVVSSNPVAGTDIKSLLFLCNKELHKKFVQILIVCQRHVRLKKTKTGITFDLGVILTVFIFFEGAPAEKMKLHAFSGPL